MVAGNLVGIEGMHGLTYLHEDEVGDVHHIVDGTDAHGAQLVLQPLGGVGHMDVLEGDAGIAGTEGGFLHGDADGVGAGVGGLGEVGNVGPIDFLMGTLAGVEDGHDVPRHTDMRGGIGTVGGDGYLEGVVLFEVEIIFGGHPNRSIVGEHLDACMVRAKLELVGCTKHAFGNGSAELAFLDFVELGVGGVDFGADLGADDFLTGCYVGGTADDVEGTVATHIYRGDV